MTLKDKPKFGGPNKLKKKCEGRVCANKTPVEYKPKKAQQLKCLGMKCASQIAIKSKAAKKAKNNNANGDSDFKVRLGVESSHLEST